ncbi:MAG: HEPN domain-containing protein [Candidatus Nanopelagicales bacterium]
MSWEPGRDTILGMLDRRELESVIASMDLATALLAQAEEAIDTARDAATSGRWYSAYANLWDGARKALSALLQAQGLRPTRTGGHVVVEHAAIAQFSGSMGAILRPVPRMRNTRNDTEYPDPDTQIEPDVVLADLDKARDIIQPAARSFRI